MHILASGPELQAVRFENVISGKNLKEGADPYKARGCVVYGQYSNAKGCSYARHNAECLDTALSRVMVYWPNTKNLDALLLL